MSKKIITSLICGVALFVLAGCAGKNSNVQNNPSSSGSAEDDAVAADLNLPKPTGSASDAADAITQEAEAEKTQAVSDDSDAKAAAGDAQDINDLSNSYDPNEIQ